MNGTLDKHCYNSHKIYIMINNGMNSHIYSLKLRKAYKYDCRQSPDSSIHTFMIKIIREKFAILLFG